MNRDALEDAIMSQNGVFSVFANTKKSTIDVIFDDRIWPEPLMKAKILEIKETHDIPPPPSTGDSFFEF